MKKVALPLVALDIPVPARESEEHWGSDPIAAILRDVDVPYISLVPGSTYRGLHDSIVNFLGNRQPQMVLAIHEECAVSIAQGYAKASDRMMAVALHANIGLLRAPMAIYNAWCDRVPGNQNDDTADGSRADRVWDAGAGRRERPWPDYYVWPGAGFSQQAGAHRDRRHRH